MMLTVEQMARITCDELNGAPQRETGPEAEAFLAKTRKEIAEAKKKGLVVDIPSEWPSISGARP